MKFLKLAEEMKSNIIPVAVAVCGQVEVWFQFQNAEWSAMNGMRRKQTETELPATKITEWNEAGIISFFFILTWLQLRLIDSARLVSFTLSLAANPI